MINKTKTAVKVLEQYKGELRNVTDVKSGNNWKAKVLDTLKQYIGADSSLYGRFNSEVFSERVETSGGSGRSGSATWIDTNTYVTHNYNANRKQNFESLINEVIAHIEHHGLKANYVKTNFLSAFSTVQIWGGILIVGNIVFWSGWFVGATQKDREVIKAEAERDQYKQQSEKSAEELNKEKDRKNEAFNQLQQEKVVLETRLDSVFNSQKKK